MSRWFNLISGYWLDSSRWTGGDPDGIGEIAEFTSIGNGTAVITIGDGTTVTVGTISFLNTSSSHYQIVSQSIGLPTPPLGHIVMQVASGPAMISVERTIIGAQASVIASNVVIHLNSSTSVTGFGSLRIDGQITGANALTMAGAGELILNHANDFSGLTAINNGVVTIGRGDAIGGGISLANMGVLRASATTTVSKQISISPVSATIAAAAGTILTLAPSQLAAFGDASAALHFGRAGDTGTVVLQTSTESSNYHGRIFIDAGTLKVGSASALTGFDDRAFTIASGAFLDTGGYSTTLGGLSGGGGIVNSGSGGLNLTVVGAASFGGTFFGKTSVLDTLTFSGSNINLINTAFNGWEGGVDLITINGGAGEDTLIGSVASDVIRGGAGNDYLGGGDGIGTDSLYGEAGDDTLSATANAVAYLDGGAGNDSLYSHRAGSVLRGGDGNDYLSGSSGGNSLYGDGGDDVIVAGDRAGGGDALDNRDGAGAIDVTTGADDDYIDGGAGNDTLYGGGGSDSILGSDGFDALYGQNGADYLFGGTGNDYLDGGDDGDFMQADSGDDSMDGGATADYLDGGDGNDSVYGGDGNDVMHGQAGNDFLSGQNGSDTIYGEAGNDVFDGGSDSAADYFDGGVGSDSYIFGAGFGRDIVGSFDDGPSGDQDVIYFAKSIFTNFAAAQAAMSQITIGPNDYTVIITFSQSHSVEIRHTNIGQLGADDFAFF